jgi:hypothetical protein
MAILTVDSLLGCSSIPNFLGGSSDTPGNPSKTIFHNTDAPINWVKNTDASINDRIMRVIGGANGTALSPGGSLAFSSVFTSRNATLPATGPSGPISDTSTARAIPTSATTSAVTDQPGSTSLFTITSSHITPHTHTYNVRANAADAGNASPQGTMAIAPTTGSQTVLATNTEPQQHSHPHTMTHTHNITASPHYHVYTSPGHTHGPLSLSSDFTVLYVDIIIATKS